MRSARLGDEGAIAEVHVRTWQAAYRGQIPADFLDALSVERRRKAWREIIATSEPPTSGAFVLEDDAQVVGFAHVAPSRDDDGDVRVGELTGIYVAPELWGAGGGRLLMERALASLGAAGFSQATLWVLDTNARARQFYESLHWAMDGAAKADEREGFTLHEVRYRHALGRVA